MVALQVSMGPKSPINQALFYELLAEGLIDNTHDTLGARSRDIEEVPDETVNILVSGVGLHLAPTNRKRKRCDGSISNAIYQGRCRVCAGCRDVKGEYIYLFHDDTGLPCFQRHLQDRHGVTEL